MKDAWGENLSLITFLWEIVYILKECQNAFHNIESVVNVREKVINSLIIRKAICSANTLKIMPNFHEYIHISLLLFN